jgi:biopolymer transport protein TolR
MRKRREERFYCRIDMSAFAAVLMAILYGMTIIATHYQPRRTFFLPRSAHSNAYPKANKEDAISVAVWRDGTLYFGSYRVTPDKLTVAIQDAVSRGADPEVYIYADSRAKYGAIAEVINAAERAGASNVALMTQPFNPEPFSHPLF